MAHKIILRVNIYLFNVATLKIYNIRTLSVNKKKCVRALEIGSIASLRRAFQACFAASTNAFYI